MFLCVGWGIQKMSLHESKYVTLKYTDVLNAHMHCSFLPFFT